MKNPYKKKTHKSTAKLKLVGATFIFNEDSKPTKTKIINVLTDEGKSVKVKL